MKNSRSECCNAMVLLFHQMPVGSDRDDHWDLMLQQDDHLLTWALDANPFQSRNAAAIQLPNHRLHYLEFEGTISAEKGNVQRVAAGSFTWLSCHDFSNWEILVDCNDENFQFQMFASVRLTINRA